MRDGARPDPSTGRAAEQPEESAPSGVINLEDYRLSSRQKSGLRSVTDRSAKVINLAERLKQPLEIAEQSCSTRYGAACVHPKYTGPSGEECEVLEYRPARDASNKSSAKFIVLNGMENSFAELRDSGQLMADALGAHVRGIVNPAEPSIIEGIYHSLVGFFSDRGGKEVERRAVSNLMDEVRESIENGQPVYLKLHSQAGIIARNALVLLEEEMLKKMTTDEWQKRAKLIHVDVYGIVVHDWPQGLDPRNLNGYIHSGDMVPWITEAVSFGVTLKNTVMGIQRQDMNYTLLPGSGRHGFNRYIENLPQFFIERFTDTDGEIQTDKLAKVLAKSIRNGEMSDEVHDQIIRAMVVLQGREFSAEFSRYVRDGKIGWYTVPPQALVNIGKAQKLHQRPLSASVIPFPSSQGLGATA